MQSLAKESITRGVIAGDVEYFHSILSAPSKASMPANGFAELLAQNAQLYGRFTSVGEPSTPFRRMAAPDFWIMTVPLFVNDIEFFVKISFNGDREIGDFQLGRKCVYHQPPYIKEDRLERIVVCEESPRTIYTRPLNAQGMVPVAILVHPNSQCNVDLRVGFSFIGRDWEFLANLHVGLLRSEFIEEQMANGPPIVPHVSKSVEFSMQLPDTGGLYLIVMSFCALFIDPIVRKFPGVIDGIVLINPVWFAPPDSNLVTMEERNVPRNIPLLIIGSGFDIMVPIADYKRWKSVGDKIGAESVFYESCDHYLLATDHRPVPREYGVVEMHLSDVPLRKIAQWIRAHPPKT
jgi:hypothetical protein